MSTTPGADLMLEDHPESWSSGDNRRIAHMAHAMDAALVPRDVIEAAIRAAIDAMDARDDARHEARLGITR